MQRAQLQSTSRVPPLAVFFLSIAGLYLARDILVPLAVAVLLAFLLTPSVRRLEIWHLGRVPSVAAVVAFAFLLATGVGWVVVNQLIEVINRLPDYRANIERKIESVRGPHGGGLARATESVRELSKELSSTPPQEGVPTLPRQPSRTQKTAPPPATVERPVPVEVVEPPPNALQSFRNILGPLVLPLGKVLIVAVFTIVMLIKREDLRSRVLRLFGLEKLNLVTQAFDDASDRVMRYLRMQFLVNAVFGTLIALGLQIIGVPSALLWGVIAGLMRFVPFVGPVIGGSLPLIVSLAVFPGWTQPLETGVLFLAIELTVAYIVEPWLYGTHTGLSSLAILVAAAFWTTLWGPIGLVLSTPLTACLMVLGRYQPQLEFLYVLLGDDPVMPPEAELYQRLLALDAQEAQAVLDRCCAEKPPAEVYDSVVIPALAMAEEDRHRGALDETHETFIMESIGEWIEKSAPSAEHDLAATAPAAGRIVCLPASDRADEIAGAMLAQLLNSNGVPVICLPASDSNGDVLEQLSLEPGDILFLSALPPFALLSSRTACKKLRERFPDQRILLGLWSNTPESANYEERLSRAFGVDVVHTIGQAADRIREIRGIEEVRPASPLNLRTAPLLHPEESPLHG
jgi:predicted PurR-regulated permease PerM